MNGTLHKKTLARSPASPILSIMQTFSIIGCKVYDPINAYLPKLTQVQEVLGVLIFKETGHSSDGEVLHASVAEWGPTAQNPT